MSTATPPRSVSAGKVTPPDIGVGLWLVVVQVLLFQLMRETSTTCCGDPFDSPLFDWMWLILPGLACVATIVRPWGSRPLWWTAALIVPFLLEVALFGWILHDPDKGASFWVLGEVAILVLGWATLIGAGLGLVVGRFLRADPAAPVTAGAHRGGVAGQGRR